MDTLADPMTGRRVPLRVIALAGAIATAASLAAAGCGSRPASPPGAGPAPIPTAVSLPATSGPADSGSAPGTPTSPGSSAAAPQPGGTRTGGRHHRRGTPGAKSPRSGSQSPTDSPSTTASPAPSRSGAPPAASGGTASTLIPASGAYLGAYIQPSQYTSTAEIAALRSFQRSIGGQIAIVHDYHPWDSPFPNPDDRYVLHSGKVLLLTWAGTPDTKKIIAGDYDGLIRARARAVKRLGRPILMEFRHEMDRPNLQWAVHGPRDYIAAWDHIRTIFSKVGASNVGWVWCPTGYGFARHRAQPFYPGNAEVDWVCADIYSPATSQSLRYVAEPFLQWARHTHKPVLIGEFAVAGTPTAWARWITAAGKLATTDHQIKGMLYFDANGTDSNGHPFQYWLGSNPRALSAFGRMLTWRVFQPVLTSG